MGLPSDLFVTAFRAHRLGLIFTVIMAIMVYFATLATAAQTSLMGATTGWSQNLQGRMTVELPPPANDTEKGKAERLLKAMTALRSLPEIADATPVSEADTSRLLKPWIDDPAILRALPLPTLIDVQTAQGQKLEAETLRQKLAPIVSDVRIESHADGMERILNLIRCLSVLAGLMAALTGVALIIAICLICRTALAVQHETVELLHLMGATNGAIAQQFQNHARRLALPAAAVGFGLAVLTIFLLASYFGSLLDRPLALSANWLTLGIVTVLTPMAAIAIAVISARLFVTGLLRRLP
jgi:cell division transport system permease protein